VVWAACYQREGSRACLQPELAFEREHRLEPTSALQSRMPVFEYTNLRNESDGHWKTVKYVDRELPRCHEDEYVGSRGMTGLYGSFPNDVWMTLDRSGERPGESTISSVYRFDGKEWKLVKVQCRASLPVVIPRPDRTGLRARWIV